MVGQSITKQDKIMNQAMKMISFEDTVRSIEMLEDGSLKVTFQKHAAIYKLEAAKAETFLKNLELSKENKKALKISVLPDSHQILHIDN